MIARLIATVAAALTLLASPIPDSAAISSAFPYERTELAVAPETPIARESAALTLPDGIQLVADVYRPQAAGRYPVILVRTIYGRAAGAQTYGAEDWARRGYAFVIQDVRGKGGSGGHFDPWANEAEDGYHSIEWAARQSWSNGRVGTLGGSYLGAVQWAAASRRPPSLRAMAILPAISDPFFGGAYDHGVLSLTPFWPWENGERELRSVPRYDETRMATLPLSQLDDALFGQNSPTWDSYLRRDRRTRWRAPRWPDAVCAASVPALIFSALWDGDTSGPVLNWEARRRCGRAGDALVLGPWGHNMAQNGRRGDVDYGEAAKVSLSRVLVDWFDARLRDNALPPPPRARVFVTGANAWRTFESWPPAEGAMSLALGADGTLSQAPQPTPARLTLHYRPDRTDRSLVDAVFARTTILPLGRDGDQLAFLTAPFVAATTLGGSPRLRLRFAPGDRDADLFAFLVDVAPDGTMRVVNQPGKQRLSYRDNGDRRLLLQPGRPLDVQIRLMDFAHRFEAGHQLGLVLRSEWFPRWARNSGGGSIGEARALRPAEHRLLLGPDRENSLTLARLSPGEFAEVRR